MPDIAVLRDELPYINAAQYASLQDAITAIGATPAVLTSPPGLARTLTADLTVPVNVTLDARMGIVETGPFKLTIDGPFKAGPWQAFDTAGGGSVVFGAGSTDKIFAEWWGAFASLASAVDSTAAIQAALNAAGVPAHVPPAPVTLLAGRYMISAKLVFPKTNGIVLKGAGIRTTRIVQHTAGQDVLSTDNVWATSTNGQVVEDIWLEGNNLAPYGLVWHASNRFRLTNVRVSACTTAGFYFSDSIVGNLVGCDADGCAIGIYADNGGNTGFNAVTLTRVSVENSTGVGVFLSDGGSGVIFNGCDIEGNAGGGIILGQSAGGVLISACYFEENMHAANATADVWVGTTGFTTGVVIDACYFNGRNTGDYYPIRIGLAVGLSVRQGNYLARGNRWIRFEAIAVSATDCHYGEPAYAPGQITATNASQLYENLPPNFARAGNRIDDSRFAPLRPENHITEDFPYAFTPFVGGGSIWAKTDNELRGQKIVTNLRRVGGDTAQLQKAFAITATDNAEMRGKFVTFLIPVKNDGTTAVAATIRTSFIAFGSAAANVVLDHIYGEAEGWQLAALTAYIPENETSFIIDIVISTDNHGFLIGRPMLYLGASLPALGVNTAPPRWLHTAAPTVGTWAVGDVVLNRAPAAGGTPGWFCTTAGTPGVWKAMANLAP